MTRLLLLIASVFVLALAVPAQAQERDPFQPLVTEAGTTTTTTGGDTSAPEAPPVPAPDAERLADTGAPTQQLVGLALALIGLGAATMLVAGQLRVRRIPHRAGSVA